MIEIALKKNALEYINVKPDFTFDDVLERFIWNFENNTDWYIYIKDNLVVGWINIKWDKKLNDKICPELFDIYVIESMRSHGIGKELINYCEKCANKKGFSEISLCVNPKENIRAKKLYEKLGFRQIGELFLDGVYHGFEDWTINMIKKI
jgi:ribosomal protein S18 acetylase RimI-like enzyme